MNVGKVWVISLYTGTSHIAGGMVKNMPATPETQVQSLAWEDPLEEEMATYSILLAGRKSWTEEPGWLQSMRLQRFGHD